MAADQLRIASAGAQWVVRLYGLLFFGCIGLVVASIADYGLLKRTASPVATAAQPAVMTDHGAHYYVTEHDAAVYRGLMLAWWIGVPAVAVLGLLLQFVAKVPAFEISGGAGGRPFAARRKKRGAPPN